MAPKESKLSEILYSHSLNFSRGVKLENFSLRFFKELKYWQTQRSLAITPYNSSNSDIEGEASRKLMSLKNLSASSISPSSFAHVLLSSLIEAILKTSP